MDNSLKNKINQLQKFGFQPNSKKTSLYKIIKLNNLNGINKNVSCRVSTHSTHSDTWLDKSQDPSKTINISIVFAISEKDNQPKLEITSKAFNQRKRNFEVNEYVYDANLLSEDDLNNVLNAISEADYADSHTFIIDDNGSVIYNDPLKGKLNAAKYTPLKSKIIENTVYIDECLIHNALMNSLNKIMINS